ncbi:MAG: hypothetical protein A2Z11_02635 [Candidatus Woykebacteria bacterium RBG_16_43_9]|uniref:GxxExxY protein n=1 Tax=Candidatus Woykebacteria bacterium RBG_16_43_9 TaxID=1802596 RepID=A0A1G1WH27_9BACT|nr:MAG: hypothetical protein A2Z11_02635 [Candidatus Woykebacteria bacterium RBG_16_43_9]
MNTNRNTKYHELLYPELSYQVQGAAIEVRKHYGPGHKETLYQRALAEELDYRKIKFEREKRISIHSPRKKVVGSYQPDFVIEDKIIVEVKATESLPRKMLDQLFDYLRNSEYELGYLINFASPKLFIKRIIYTNDRKGFING